MEKTNSFYVPCSDCSLKPLEGNYKGMIFDRGSYKCVFGYNDCSNVIYSNNPFESRKESFLESDLTKKIEQDKTDNLNNNSESQTPSTSIRKVYSDKSSNNFNNLKENDRPRLFPQTTGKKEVQPILL